ncbi:hypothetical protein D9611_001126 [Ephemerocybe angulata]|uniref:Uncharacterized protein n=1 Tax=Ephemerocybe angulata TaxID=980116 RepID=A0A8H5FML2_9AGAR|nr:hypothetical protein D9611_001126 [Tulosesus angulatus]
MPAAAPFSFNKQARLVLNRYMHFTIISSIALLATTHTCGLVIPGHSASGEVIARSELADDAYDACHDLCTTPYQQAKKAAGHCCQARQTGDKGTKDS